MTVSEYAKSRGISREAVSKQIRVKEKTELLNHVHKERRGWILDDVAVTYLDGHRLESTVSIVCSSDAVDALKAENNQLKEKLISVLEDQNRYMTELSDTKVRCAELTTKAALLDATSETQTQKIESLERDLEVARREALTFREKAEAYEAQKFWDRVWRKKI